MNTLISVENLNKTFGSHTALNQVSFDIKKGQTTALVGPNGAGKTTLFSILCGYLTPDKGKVSILGSPLGSESLFGLLSALPQDAALDPRFSLNKQLGFYAKLQGMNNKAAKHETHRVLDLVGLSENHNARIDELSHGMRKRVSIAQALIGQPQIVLLDEATAGLDPINAREIRTLIAELSHTTTFILSSHDLAELERLCNNVLYLDRGVLSCHNTDNKASEQKFLTLQFTDEPHQVLEHLKQLSGVLYVKQSQNKEFIIEYDAANTQFDVDLLKYCHKLNWQYRKLVNGHTLENQLFEQN